MHRYQGLDHAELHREASGLKEVWASLLKSVKEFLSRHGGRVDALKAFKDHGQLVELGKDPYRWALLKY